MDIKLLPRILDRERKFLESQGIKLVSDEEAILSFRLRVVVSEKETMPTAQEHQSSRLRSSKGNAQDLCSVKKPPSSGQKTHTAVEGEVASQNVSAR